MHAGISRTAAHPKKDRGEYERAQIEFPLILNAAPVRAQANDDRHSIPQEPNQQSHEKHAHLVIFLGVPARGGSSQLIYTWIMDTVESRAKRIAELERIEVERQQAAEEFRPKFERMMLLLNHGRRGRKYDPLAEFKSVPRFRAFDRFRVMLHSFSSRARRNRAYLSAFFCIFSYMSSISDRTNSRFRMNP